MPIAKFGDELVYFAHVPKAGGTGVVELLRARGGLVAFEDQQHAAVARKHRWSRTSPQHIDLDALERIVPNSFFGASFAVVRHPADRLVSLFHFQMEVEQKIWANRDFSKWLRGLPRALARRPYLYDNHVRPMNDLVPSAAMVFYIENGLDLIVPWLDALLDDTAPPRTIARTNVRRETSVARVRPSDEDLRVIAELYHVDFQRFGYEVKGRLAPCNGERPAAQRPPMPSSRLDLRSQDSLINLAVRGANRARAKYRSVTS